MGYLQADAESPSRPSFILWTKRNHAPGCDYPRTTAISASKGHMPTEFVQEHVELIAKHEQEFLDRRTTGDRLGDIIAGAAGSLTFVFGHLVGFALWAGLNLIPGIRHFDPSPFSLLSTIVALEAILLASFILMRQVRIGRRSEEREHLMLQILLLTEKELTAALELNREIARKVGLGYAADRPQVEELSQQTPIDDVAQTIREKLAAE